MSNVQTETAAAPRRGRGRPPTPPELRYRAEVKVRALAPEAAAWTAAAARAGQPVSAWMRDLANAAAEQADG